MTGVTDDRLPLAVDVTVRATDNLARTIRVRARIQGLSVDEYLDGLISKHLDRIVSDEVQEAVLVHTLSRKDDR